jgi:hypothetical protein
MAQLELSIFSLDGFVSRFIDELSYLEFRSRNDSELIGCSFGKMWILTTLSWGYRIRVSNDIKRFSNLYDVSKFVFKSTWNSKYYETNADVISNQKKLAAEGKRYKNLIEKRALAEAQEEQSLKLKMEIN